MRELGEKGKLGFITADSFLLGRFFSKIRKSILDTCKISEIVLFQKDFWESGVIGKPVITILQKEFDKNSRRENNLIGVSALLSYILYVVVKFIKLSTPNVFCNNWLD